MKRHRTLDRRVDGYCGCGRGQCRGLAVDHRQPIQFPIGVFFACGVLPLASLLILVGSFSVPERVRGSTLSPFILGFESVGWLVVFAFISWYSIATDAVIGCVSAIAAPIQPSVMSYLQNAPDWVKFSAEFGLATVLFSLPQLILALLADGWPASSG